jgi:hypothetical protein
MESELCLQFKNLKLNKFKFSDYFYNEPVYIEITKNINSSFDCFIKNGTFNKFLIEQQIFHGVVHFVYSVTSWKCKIKFNNYESEDIRNYVINFIEYDRILK